MGKNFARTDHSGNSLGTAKCQMIKAWQFTSPQTAVYNSPVIYKDTVIWYTLDRITALDINTGAVIWQRLSDALEIGDGCYSTPTVQDGIIYTGGGSTQAFTALRVSNGTTVWTRDFTVHGIFTTFSPSVIVDVAGTNVVIYSDDAGKVYAANALTGAAYPGWTVNPVAYPAAINRGLTTDGHLVFCRYRYAFPFHQWRYFRHRSGDRRRSLAVVGRRWLSGSCRSSS
jgi:outer membrane protein assembly factor BamB